MRARIGVIGAGQLGRMMALAGYSLGQSFRFLDVGEQSPGAQVGPILLGEFSDPERMLELAAGADVVTFDVENVPAEHAARVAEQRPFRPPPVALATAQDRLNEKTMFVELGIPTPRFAAVDTRQDLDAAAEQVGLPLVLKTRRLGYDGRGQTIVKDAADLDRGFERLGGVPLIAEEFIDFEREVSAIAARSPSGERVLYPLSHNVHDSGILRYSIAPYHDAKLETQARNIIDRMLARFDYAGVLTIEFFVRDGTLVANEIAPRVHNSGHWTIEGAVTSQFENHVRAITDLPLGSAAARGHSAMVNFLGQMPDINDVLAIDGAHFHDYGKSPRPMRKIGHGTVTAETPAERDEALKRLLAIVDR